MGLPNRFEPGPRLIDGSDLNKALATLMLQSKSDMAATAGGGRANAVSLLLGINSFVTVASAADSAVLPKAVEGRVLILRNGGANAMQVFAEGSDTVAGVAGATGISIANGKSALFFCFENGKWDDILSA